MTEEAQFTRVDIFQVVVQQDSSGTFSFPLWQDFVSVASEPTWSRASRAIDIYRNQTGVNDGMYYAVPDFWETNMAFVLKTERLSDAVKEPSETVKAFERAACGCDDAPPVDARVDADAMGALVARCSRCTMTVAHCVCPEGPLAPGPLPGPATTSE